jgi:hypothetical protein
MLFPLSSLFTREENKQNFKVSLRVILVLNNRKKTGGKRTMVNFPFMKKLESREKRNKIWNETGIRINKETNL